MAKKKDLPYIMNVVEGFNPYDYVEDALDSEGNPIVLSNGENLRYISTDAKKLWFLMKCPQGRIHVQRMEEKNPATVRYSASVFTDAKDESPKATWEYQLTCSGEDFDQMASKVQTVALGKALSLAGFGCEIELALKQSVEIEKKTPEKKPVVKVSDQDLSPEILAMIG